MGKTSKWSSFPPNRIVSVLLGANVYNKFQTDLAPPQLNQPLFLSCLRVDFVPSLRDSI